MLTDLQLLADSLPDSVDLWIGGCGARNIFERQLLPKKYQFIDTLEGFNNRLQNLTLETR